MPREHITGWYNAWRRNVPDVITAVILVLILAVSLVIAYFSMRGIEDYDSPDVPETARSAPSNARN